MIRNQDSPTMIFLLLFQPHFIHLTNYFLLTSKVPGTVIDTGMNSGRDGSSPASQGACTLGEETQGRRPALGGAPCACRRNTHTAQQGLQILLSNHTLISSLTWLTNGLWPLVSERRSCERHGTFTIRAPPDRRQHGTLEQSTSAKTVCR